MTQVADAGRGTSRVEQIMGMPIAIDLRDEDVDPAALEHAFDWFRFVDATFSTYKDDSEISRLNRGELPLAQAHPDVRAVLERCAELREETSGYFDADAAGGEAGVDPSGLVKGWSVDRAARILETFGAGNFSIDAGGDIVLRGEPSPGRPWRVGIRHPLLHGELAAVVAARRARDRDLGDLRARGAHPRPPCRGAAHGRPLGDDRWPGASERRRICDRRVRDGSCRGRVGRHATGLRGDDDPRGRAGALDPGLPGDPLSARSATPIL